MDSKRYPKMLAAAIAAGVMAGLAITGAGLAQEVKTLRGKAGPNRTTPAIAVTADVSFGGHSSQLAQGFSDQVIKPLRAPELLGAIARTVRPTAKRRARRA